MLSRFAVGFVEKKVHGQHWVSPWVRVTVIIRFIGLAFFITSQYCMTCRYYYLYTILFNFHEDTGI
jgi:uncharacterized membrane protein